MTFCPEALGTKKGTVQLDRLYPDAHEREGFERRWPSFLASDPSLKEVAWRAGADQLSFLTESLLPIATDARAPVLLVLGNPAPHSVLNGLPFSFEATFREHRFWIALREAGLLRFDVDGAELANWSERNQQRKEAMYALRYHSPFRLAIAVYYSMPSPAAAAVWAGVAGLRKLFGSRALSVVARAEEERLARVIGDFNAGKGAVIAFQRDAYEGIRSKADATYSARDARESRLEARCKFDARIPLLGGPPTRLMHSVAARAALARIKDRLMGPV